jgi:PPM family protein phosphatase
MDKKYKITAVGKTDIGSKRKVNQDSIIVNETCNLYAIADGMGGHKGGEIASAMILEILNTSILNIYNERKILRPVTYLKEIVSLASIKIFEKAKIDHNLKGMGTTLISLFIYNSNVYITQVGDSRAYLYRSKIMWRLSEDHSLINEQLRSGLISKDQAEKADYKNVITRSVGFEEHVESDVYVRALTSGDIFLLCSDGLSSLVSDEEISKNIDVNNYKKTVDTLIKIANDKGGNDNISVILIGVR